MRLSAQLFIAATLVTVIASQQPQFAVPVVSVSSCDRPDTTEPVKGDKGDPGYPGKMGPAGPPGKIGETPQQIDLQEIWNAVTAANENIRELTEKNAALEENFTKLEEEHKDLQTKVHTNTAQLELVREAAVSGVTLKPNNNSSNVTSHTDSDTTTTEAVPVERSHARDCQELLTEGSTSSGVYEIRDPSGGGGTIEVYCDMLTNSGGWTVLQKRNSGSVDFYQGWQQYKAGFGDVSTEYWLGLENLHHLTSGRTMKLRVVLKYFDDNEAYAEYSSFSVAPSSDNYRLSISGYSGTAGDSLRHHNGWQFTTKDADHDAWNNNCATSNHGAWWYRGCGQSNLNGRYYTSARSGYDGVVWYHFKNNWRSLKEAKMMIRV